MNAFTHLTGPDPRQRKPCFGARAGEPDAPHVTWGERPLAGTRRQDAELDQPLDVLWEDAGPTGQLKAESSSTPTRPVQIPQRRVPADGGLPGAHQPLPRSS
jgi:hypothetical protein